MGGPYVTTGFKKVYNKKIQIASNDVLLSEKNVYTKIHQTMKICVSQVPSPDLMGPWGTVDRRQLDSIEYWLEHNVGADFVCVDGEDSTYQDQLLWSRMM